MRTIKGWINLDLAQAHAIQFGRRLHADVTRIKIKKPVVVNHDINTYLGGETPAITQAQVCAFKWPGGFFTEEIRVIDTRADKGLKPGAWKHVILQAKRWW